jgi:hypothetical protein
MDTEYEFHPIANAFPLAEGKNREDLARRLLAEGLLHPIVLYQNMILDGRDRYLICKEHNLDMRFNEYTGDDPIGHVESHNLARKHLSIGILATAAAKLANIKLGENQYTKEGVCQHTPSISLEQAADKLGVSRSTAAYGKAVIDHTERTGDDTLEKEVVSGKTSVKAAAKKARASKPRAKGQTKRKSDPDIEKRNEQIIALHDKGKSQPEIVKELGAPHKAVRHVIEGEEKKRQGKAEALADPEIKREDLSKTSQEKLDAAIRQHKKKLDLEYDEKVRLAVVARINESMLPWWVKKLETIQGNIDRARRKGIMNASQFKMIKSAIHPDRIPDQCDPKQWLEDQKKRNTDAFSFFNGLELLLVSKDVMPTPVPSPTDVPRTYADLMKRKQEVTETRRAAAKKGAATRAARQGAAT